MEFLNIRERTEAAEHQMLSEYASFSDRTKGRAREEEPCEIRTAFQRDRDRIIHCKSFRRLKHKTQVFLAPEGDHYRTRLTHTLEVSQIARTIAGALKLNGDLTEAIALGHDLGHTPFGHAGEKALDMLSEHGFKHYEQSVRVVERIEKDGKGLNLTQEVLNGILCHTKGKEADTLEGRIVRLSDRIAYINHDIDDALRAGVLSESDIPADITEALGNKTSKRINSLVTSLILNSHDNELAMEPKVWQAFDELHEFMYKNVYYSPYAKAEERKIPNLIEALFRHFMTNPDFMPEEYKAIARQEDTDRAVCDFIAGMTDHYAIQLYENLFIPKGWSRT